MSSGQHGDRGVDTVLVTGATGQLGHDLVRLAGRQGISVIAQSSAELDITDADAVRRDLDALAGLDPRAVVINAAAYTAVDAAQTERERAFAVNADGPAALGRAASATGLRVLHVSTDYVFPGDAARPYEVDDPTGPLGVYGASKLAGEQALLEASPTAQVVRTAWVYGAHGANFVRTMIRLARGEGTVSVVDDQRGAPTHAQDLAAGLLQLAASPVGTGGPVLHATSSGETTWFDFARTVFAAVGADPDRVEPITSALRPAPAARPAYSVLSNAAWGAAGLTPLPPWRPAFDRAFAEHREALGAGPATTEQRGDRS